MENKSGSLPSQMGERDNKQVKPNKITEIIREAQ